MSQSAEWIATARVLRRSGFGASGPAVDAALRTGRAAYVHAMIASDPEADAGARSTPLPHFAPVASLGRNASKDERGKRNEALRGQLQQLTTWWLRRMVAAQQPFGERLTFAWHDHFATSSAKARDARQMGAQNELFRRRGRGDFRNLALAVLTDAAMLRWLDGQKNTVKAPNENLAREFMELFTLGHGDAYTETDVREGARALTGWRIGRDGLSTELRANLHDNGTKKFLGVSGNIDTEGYCDVVLAQPGGARFVATKVWTQFASGAAPSAATLNRLLAAYGDKRDLSALLSATFTDPEFTAPRTSIVVSPVEWLIGLVRALRIPVHDDHAALKLLVVLRALGQIPFRPPNVSGWPSGHAWLSTAAADTRRRAATSLVTKANLDAVNRAARAERVDAAGHLLGVGRWTARTRSVLDGLTGDARQLVATAAISPEYLTH